MKELLLTYILTMAILTTDLHEDGDARPHPHLGVVLRPCPVLP